ncbi:MAG: RNA polymerase sigma factor [Steroidobacteraceae bacterium]
MPKLQRTGQFAKLAREKYWSHLMRCIHKRVNNPDDVAEISQEILLKLMRVPDHRQFESPLRYIYRTVKHAIDDFLRREGNKFVISDSDLAAEAAERPIPDLPLNVLEATLDAELRLLAALSGLRREYLEVVRLRVRENLSYREIGVRAGLSTQSAEQYYQRAVRLILARYSRLS